MSTRARRLVSLLWLAPAIVFAVAVLLAPSHVREPAQSPQLASRAPGSAPIDPTTARQVFETLTSADGACTFDGVTTSSTRIEARWHRGDAALPPAVVTRAWGAIRAGDQFVVTVPSELRSTCPGAASALDRLGERVGDGRSFAVARAHDLSSPISLASARWLWIAIAFALALVTRWVVLALGDDEDPQSS